MFKVATEPTFTHTVKASVPVDGGHETQSFKATFRVLSPEEVEQHDLNTVEGSTGFLKAVVKGLDDIGDAEGQPVPFNDSVLDQVLRLPWARVALSKAYFGALSKAAEGN